MPYDRTHYDRIKAQSTDFFHVRALKDKFLKTLAESAEVPNVLAKGTFLSVDGERIAIGYLMHTMVAEGRVVCDKDGKIAGVEYAFEMRQLVGPVFTFYLWLGGTLTLDAQERVQISDYTDEHLPAELVDLAAKAMHASALFTPGPSAARSPVDRPAWADRA